MIFPIDVESMRTSPFMQHGIPKANSSLISDLLGWLPSRPKFSLCLVKKYVETAIVPSAITTIDGKKFVETSTAIAKRNFDIRF